MDGEEKKSFYNLMERSSQNPKSGFGLHYFPDITGEKPDKMRRCSPSEENFQRVRYNNDSSSCVMQPSEGQGNYYRNGSLSTAQLNEQAYQKGFTDGKKEGLIDAENTWHEIGAKKLEPVLLSLQEALLQLKSLRKEIHRQIENEVVELSLAIAKQVICREITIDREIIVGVAREALAKVEDPGRIKIKMSPSDLQFINENPSYLSNLVDNIDNISFEAAECIQTGGCTIETDLGEIDARIENQLEAVEESFRTALDKS